MKRVFNNSYFITYIELLCGLLLNEVIFKIISGFEIFNFSFVRIFLFLNIITAILSYFINFAGKILRKILVCFILFAASFYTCLQLGFFNFLGVYISFQTSSQLGAVTDYIKDFFLSFHPTYLLTFIPFIIVLIIEIIFHRKNSKINYINSLLISLLFVILSSGLFYATVDFNVFQNKYQSVSNKELFLTASNPSVTIDQFGSLGFCFLDIKAMLFPVYIEQSYAIEENENAEITENSRIIDDTAWKLLNKKEKNKTYKTLNNYFINRSISEKNDYTGLFENKNLIVILMESVNDIMLKPEYYPNFNKILTNGWYFENNYSPRNSCATMNNEFSGMTSLYSIYNTCTASKYKANTYYESIFNLFNRKGYVTFSAHDYTQAYYPRRVIHKNMGSGEYYGVDKLRISYSNQYINWANDDEFLDKMLKIIDSKTKNNKHFMTWLTTVSSHQPYSVSSIQGDKYYSMTKNTNYASDVRRFMSKLKILDNGLGILLKGLESRGILDDTVIVLYGDHYPYGISTSHLNKALDYNTSVDLNAERVPFIIYNSTVTPKVYSDYTSYLNILPTVANLFNLDYDPRLYLGEDLFSDNYHSLTVFADGSWKNEIAYYNATKNKIKYYTSTQYTKEQIMKINEEIKTKVDVSNDVIKNNYFAYLDSALKESQATVDEMRKTMCFITDYHE